MRAREVRLQVAQSGTPDSRREPAILPLLYFPGTILEQKRVVRFSCACANTKAMNEIAIEKAVLESRSRLIAAGVRNLKVFGYPSVTPDNILTDQIYSAFFKGMVKETASGVVPTVIKNACAIILKEIESKEKS